MSLNSCLVIKFRESALMVREQSCLRGRRGERCDPVISGGARDDHSPTQLWRECRQHQLHIVIPLDHQRYTGWVLPLDAGAWTRSVEHRPKSRVKKARISERDFIELISRCAESLQWVTAVMEGGLSPWSQCVWYKVRHIQARMAYDVRYELYSLFLC